MTGKSSRLALRIALVALLAGVTGCHRHKHAPPDLTASQEPDKILYQKAVEDIGNKRFDVARLTLQTLLNTYPDSDYLADAKMAIADSYYEEGTSAALTHAEIEYKDYITFFPNTLKVPYAQYRAAMCHYRQLEKPDRDTTHARRAEREFQLLLLNYPDSEYAADGEKKLLQVQEVLAEGMFRVGRFYYIRGSWRAAASRLAELVERYPNYSRRDQALWMLARTFEKQIPYFWEPDPERAAEYYARIIREHPLSHYVPDAKAELTRLGQPIPEPDPVLLARAQTVEPIAMQEGEGRGLLGRMFGLFSGRPDTSAAAARLGPPPLEPPAEPPRLPPPTLYAGQARTTVAVETLEDVPAGAVVQTAGGESNPDGNSESEPDKNNKKQNKSPSRKKSFWRKLIPFF